MKEKNKLNQVLRLSLLITIPTLLMMWQFKASAVKNQSEEIKKINKGKLPKMNLSDRLAFLKPQVSTRLTNILPQLSAKQTKITIIVYKKERIVELWKSGKTKQKLKTYKMTLFSGQLGPKSRQGDFQIPEGVYRASHLNPNSKYYLSIGVNYPNANDRKRGKKQAVKDLGGDIFIHGKAATIGCVPIGDHYIEELFYIVAKVGVANTKVIMAPTRLPLPSLEKLGPVNNSLMREKYTRLAAELTEYL